MESIKNLDLFLFEGVPERATRHYADDLHSFEADRGTRDGILEEQSQEGANVILANYTTIEYAFDHEHGEMVLTIK